MRNTDLTDARSLSSNQEGNATLEREYKQRTTCKKLKKKLKKYSKLYKSAASGKKNSRKKYKKKIRKLKKRLRETEYQLETLRIKTVCEQTMLQWYFQSLPAHQPLPIHQLPESQPYLALPDFTGRNDK